VPAPVRQHRRKILVIGALVGVAVAFAPPRLTAPFGEYGPSWFLIFLAVFLVSVLLHEVGHLVAGLQVGFDFRVIVAGPLMLSRESKGYRFRLLPSRTFGGGFTAMNPMQPEDLRRRFTIFVAGGPLVTFILLLASWLMPWGIIPATLLLANLLIAASSWIPYVTKGQPTDAKMIQLLQREGAPSDRLAAILYLMAVDANGVRPRDWPQGLMQKLTAHSEDTAYRSAGFLYRYLYVRDAGDVSEAAAALEALLAAESDGRPDLRRVYFAEAAYFQGSVAHNAALAKAWLADARNVKQAIRLEGWDAAAMAGIAIAEGNQAQARAEIARAIEYLDRRAGKNGSVAAARDRLIALRDAVA
jgi:Peptidase family M50